MTVVKNTSDKRVEVQCNVCSSRHERYLCQTNMAANAIHFCSRKCLTAAKQPGGLIAEATKRTNLARYGVVNTFQSPEKQAKARATLIRKYGVDNPQKVLSIQERTKQTCVAVYGTDNPAKSQVIKARTSATRSQKTDEDRQQTLNKRKATNVERFGYAFPMQVPSIKDAFDFANVAIKAHQTKLANGSYGNSSLAERDLGTVLCELYGQVNEQVRVTKRWAIDFYVPLLDTYVQLDGVYWHGLDRPIEVIEQFKSSKDVRIRKKIDNDVAQNAWFEQNRLRLVRFTDIEVKEWQSEARLQTKVKERLEMMR
jgi:hypothetical protein